MRKYSTPSCNLNNYNPFNSGDIIFLNHNGLKNSTDVAPPSCEVGQSCYTSLTPKAYDVQRTIHTRLDRPSQVAGIYDTNRYTEPQLNEYTAGMNSFEINGDSEYSKYSECGDYSQKNNSNQRFGQDYALFTSYRPQSYGRGIDDIYSKNIAQIEYYVDKGIVAPFHAPVFDMPSITTSYDYIDPMGTWKQHYTLDIQTPEKYSCLSWLNDSSFHREDIISRQQSVHNQQRSEPFFASAPSDCNLRR